MSLGMKQDLARWVWHYKNSVVSDYVNRLDLIMVVSLNSE